MAPGQLFGQPVDCQPVAARVRHTQASSQSNNKLKRLTTDEKKASVIVWPSLLVV